MRNPLKLPGVPQTNETISAASGPKFTILWGQDENIISASAMQGGHKQKHFAQWHLNKHNYSMNRYVFKTKRLHSGSGFQHSISTNRICSEVACIKVDFTVLVHKAATTEVVVVLAIRSVGWIFKSVQFQLTSAGESSDLEAPGSLDDDAPASAAFSRCCL